VEYSKFVDIRNLIYHAAITANITVSIQMADHQQTPSTRVKTAGWAMVEEEDPIISRERIDLSVWHGARSEFERCEKAVKSNLRMSRVSLYAEFRVYRRAGRSGLA
jgi:hypothetical protein